MARVTAGERLLLPVQSQTAFLQFRTVACQAVFAKDGLYITGKFDLLFCGIWQIIRRVNVG